MITVFVSDQDSVQVMYVLANRCQALRYFTTAQTGIDQNPGLVGRDKCRVARTAAR
jgi:hypothetical protein